jgi:lipid-binding SYLF domain-containing protein
MLKARLVTALLAVALTATSSVNTRPALAASAADINRDANAVLAKLYANKPEAKKLASQAKAILIFPSIYKAGFMFGAQYGEGVLRQGEQERRLLQHGGRVVRLAGGRSGVRVRALLHERLRAQLPGQKRGLRGRCGPSIVVLDEGAGKSMTSSTVTQDIYALIFDQKGLMAGAGIQGSKISKIAK